MEVVQVLHMNGGMGETSYANNSLVQKMDVTKVLHMNSGLGETSYANNSLVQRKVISMTKPIAEEAITELYLGQLKNSDTISIADLGCSSGPNTLFVAAELIKTVDKLRRKLGRDRMPEFQIHLNDLPGNDFNSIFRSLLPRFESELKKEIGSGLGPCPVYAVPGSFYGRLFASRSLHFVHSSYSLMWLSKVPEGVEMNKENIYMASGSPEDVIRTYYAQFQRDFSTFLKCRSDEVVAGGKMVLTILGRRSDDACSKECCYIWELMALALKQMVSQGLIEEEKLHSFHIPQYTPSPAEVAAEVEKEGSFTINRLEASEITWSACGGGRVHSSDNKLLEYSTVEDGYNVSQCMRSVAEPLLVQHFGEAIIDQLFEEYQNILTDRMSKEETKFVNVTVFMTRINCHV